MNKNSGISEQTYMTMATYILVVIFHSSTLLSAAAAAGAVLFVQCLAYFILPVIAEKMPHIGFPYTAALFTVLGAVFVYRLYGLIPIDGMSAQSTVFPDPTFLLLLVPLLIEQSAGRNQYSLRFIAGNDLLFTMLLLLVAVIREALGFGTLLHIRLFAENSAPLLLLTHASGAAFLTLAVILTALFLYRKATGTSKVLAVGNEDGPYTEQPVLDRDKELGHMKTALFSLIPVSASMPVLFFVSLFCLPNIPDFDIMLLACILVLGAFSGTFYLVFGKHQPYFREMLCLPWLIPVQTMVLALPFSFPIGAIQKEKGTFLLLAGLLIYLICTWLIAAGVLLFRQSIKRRLLFGRRPGLMTGLPLMILIGGLCLMILAGFAAIPESILSIAVL